ncbi:MAG: hypothetical protein JXC36_03120, partial [Candidatus Atribacteria bacterium]|nr:hypothetical protein [Candidatus Atribacteria bacterium]
MNLRLSSINIAMIICLGLFCFQPSHAFDMSQQLFYESSYHPSESQLNQTLTLNMDYFQEISTDLFIEGDLILRSSNKTYSKPLIAGPNEIYISAYNIIKDLDLRVGKIITRWGSADLFSPLDNFNPSPPALSFAKNQEKIGAIGLHACYYMNDSTYLEAAVLPKLKTTPYPDQYLKDSYLANYGSFF